jgi:aspartyl-tRNA(Asn)/glutamyl-tRNA(Gln) amidotransferase subunit B
MTNYIINGKNAQFEVVIGCEIHAQISSNSKLFSRSSTEFGSSPNNNVSLIDAAMPGMLPIINQKCVIEAIKTGLAINATINKISYFDRKNYFYPDLPQGYQISQFFTPIVENGEVEIILENGSKKKIRIERIHLEQDAGKLIHDQNPRYSLIDLNRAGIGLMEIVSKPDLSSPEEAANYVKTIRAILRTVGSSDGDMEKGNLRCDANVSVRRVGDNKLGTRCEIKNLNSTRNIAKAIEFEAYRQVAIIESGGLVEQETRLFNPNSGETATMRSKEDAMDYRYFPDPDLPPLLIDDNLIKQIQESLPELPEARKSRYIDQFKINNEEASLLVSDNLFIEYFEKLIIKIEPKLAVTWLTVELFGRLKKANIEFENNPIDSNKFIELLELIVSGEISGKIAKEVLDEMFVNNANPKEIIVSKGLQQVSNEGEIARIIERVIDDNPAQLAEYISGKDKLFAFFIGQIMKETKGKANPTIVNRILQEQLNQKKL